MTTAPELPNRPTDEQMADYLRAYDEHRSRTAGYPNTSPAPVRLQRLDIVVARNTQDVVIVCARCRAVILDGAFYDIVDYLDHHCETEAETATP